MIVVIIIYNNIIIYVGLLVNLLLLFISRDYCVEICRACLRKACCSLHQILTPVSSATCLCAK